MRVCAALILALGFAPVLADEPVRVAVASNFAGIFNVLADDFSAQTGVEVRQSYGSTGKLYAQVRNGAPFDVFLAADVDHPRLLEEAGLAEPGSRFTYAIGRLVLWSRTAEDCVEALLDGDAGRIAIPNPNTAPYGRAAHEYLAAVDQAQAVVSRKVTTSSVSQAFFYAASKNVVVAFISWSYSKLPEARDSGCAYKVPATMHAPIEQQAVLVNEDSDSARRFLSFLGSDKAKALIRDAGYEVPE